jgi:integrase
VRPSLVRYLDAGMLTGNHSVVVALKGLVEKTTKSNRYRTAALDPGALALLEQHRSRVMQWINQAHGELSADAFVFSPYVEAMKPFRPDNVTSFFIRVRNEVGAPSVRLHDLRHFTATQLIGAGVDVRTVARRLGHSDPSVTLRVYSHALEERDRAAAAIMGDILRPLRRP